MDKDTDAPRKDNPKEQSPGLLKRLLRYVAITVAVLLLLAGGSYGYAYATTPDHIKHPKFQHYHFRTQIVVNGKVVDFSDDTFQKKYEAVNCNADIADLPIHFHDHVDQMTHIHWDGMTGGEFLKAFGWNFIGGNNSVLGYRFDLGAKPVAVKTYGKLLPAAPDNAKYYVYVGDADEYTQKDWNDFLNKDFEAFFGKKSKLGQANTPGFSIANWFFPRVSAHGGEDHGTSQKSEEELSRINNLLGNVVIFAQEKEPTKEQINARFDALVPLSDSTCGG